MADKNDCLKCKMVNRGEFNLKDGIVELVWQEGEKEKAKFPIHVYALVEVSPNGKSLVRYVGETTNSLLRRMDQYLKGYKNKKNQPTNYKVHENILENLKIGHQVVLLSLLDDKPVTWAGSKVNLAKGIESALIANWLPEWNGSRGKKLQLESSGEKVELIHHLY